MQKSEDHLRIVHGFRGEGGGETVVQSAGFVFKNLGHDAAHALQAVCAGGAQNGHSRADDVVAFLGVVGMTMGRVTGELSISTPVEDGADHYALIAVISTLV